jgi:hypothetical protein
MLECEEVIALFEVVMPKTGVSSCISTSVCWLIESIYGKHAGKGTLSSIMTVVKKDIKKKV